MDSGLLVILIFGAMLIIDHRKPITKSYTHAEIQDIVLAALRQHDEDTSVVVTIYDPPPTSSASDTAATPTPTHQE